MEPSARQPHGASSSSASNPEHASQPPFAVNPAKWVVGIAKHDQHTYHREHKHQCRDAAHSTLHPPSGSARNLEYARLFHLQIRSRLKRHPARTEHQLNSTWESFPFIWPRVWTGEFGALG
eukprot:3154793-Rhodomonas_salina.1